MSKKLRSDRREARRQGARDRFKIRSFKDMYKREWTGPDGPVERDYLAYVDRKLVEAVSLGLGQKGLSKIQMLARIADPSII